MGCQFVHSSIVPLNSPHGGPRLLELRPDEASAPPQSHQNPPSHSHQSQNELPESSSHLSETFWNAFKAHLDEKHVVLDTPKIEGKGIKLHQLFFIVNALGGYRAVSPLTFLVIPLHSDRSSGQVQEKQLWSVVEAKLGLLDLDEAKESRPALTDQLSSLYHNTLADFEAHWSNSLQPSDPGSLFPFPHHLQFLHPEIKKLANTTTITSSELDGPLYIEPQHETNAAVQSRFLTTVRPENPRFGTLRLPAEDATKIKVTLPTSPGTPKLDVEDLLREAGELRLDSLEMRGLDDLTKPAAGEDQRASAMVAELDRAGPNPPLDRTAWDALFFEAYRHNYRLHPFEEVGRVVERIRLLEVPRSVQDTSLTMEDVEELQNQALTCSLPSKNEEFFKLKELAERGTRWHKYAHLLLNTSIVTLQDLDKLATPPYPAPVFHQLLESIGSLRARACEIEKQAKAILYPSLGSRTPIPEALRLVSSVPKCFFIPAVQILAEVAPQAAHIEKTCFDMINNRYSPRSFCQSPVEELRDMRNTVQEKLRMFAIPSFDIADQQLAQHDAWLEKLPWYRAGDPAMQPELIVDEVLENTQPGNDAPPSDPACTCICLLPVKNASGRQANVVRCYDCGAKFHSKCVEGSCPFCDHHHWSGALAKPRNFEFTDLLQLATTVPDLTRNYSSVWNHISVIITSVGRLIKSIAAFLSGLLETTTSPPPTLITKIRHFLRILYKIQFRIRARADLPPYGLSLCYLYRYLANKTQTRDAARPRRPYFFFTAEHMPLASDGSRCICKGSRGGHHLLTCKSCSFKFHANCVILEDASNSCPEHWRCPMCVTRKGKQYPQSAVRVRAIGEHGIVASLVPGL